MADPPTALLPNPLAQRPPRAINQYRLISLLGKGGMGEVWLAEDTRLKRQVALKLLPAECTSDAERLRRFEQEALAISALNHPNIITIHEIGESEAGRFIVMELVAGRTLRAIAAGPVAIDSLIAWGSQLAKALHVAHAAGITHRDIKPDNIMVRDDGYVKLLDFGIARLNPLRNADFGLRNEEAASIAQQTAPGTLLGTVAYMSPEQARGETVSHPSDVFALGIVLYELATGRHPFKADTLVGYLHAITLQTPTPPQQWQPGIPAALNELLLRMLEKAASRRPTASEAAQKLQAIERLPDSVAANTPLMLTPHPLPSVPSTPIRHTVGREPERHELRAAFMAAMNGRGSLVCVAGEPGIGKTTLVEDFLAELAAENRATLARGRCSERLAGTEAYLPLLEALEALLRQADTHSLARTMKPGDEALGSTAQLLRRLAPTWYAQVAPLSAEDVSDAQLLAEVKAASPERMKRELANFLHAVAEQRPLVLFFDDLHWADVSTIDLLSLLAGKFDGLRVLIVVTYRPSDMLLAKHPFLQIKPDLQARGACRELLLEFLTEAEIAEYLALEFPGHRFPPAFAQLIHAKTEGSPLFMADLARYLCDRGVIRKADASTLPLETETFATASLTEVPATWTLAEALPDIERALPESVRGMIERKLAQLSEDDRKLLTAASVQGYEFDSAVVAQVLGLDANEIEERLEKLERVFAFVKLVSEAEFPNGTLTLRYRFVHVLYQNALYAELRATRKATLSREVALALEACYGARSASVANELALLWEAARDYARASDSYLQAARNAAQIHAHREAVQLAERGLTALGKLPETPERDGRELGLQLTLGFSLQSVLSWAAPEAGAAFNRARQLCERAGNDPRLFAALSGVWPYHALQAQFEAAQRLGEQMLQLAEQAQDPVLLVRVFMCRAFVDYYQGELVAAHQYGERALALERRADHAAYLSVSNEDLGITTRRHQSYCLWTLGYADSALALARETVTLAGQIAHPFSLAGAHLAVGMILHTQRDWPASQQAFEQVLALAAEYDLGDMFNYAAAFNALTRAYQAPDAAALAQAQQAIATLRGKGVTLALTAYLSILGEVFGLADRYAEGLAVIAEGLAQAERTGERVWEAELWRLKGALLLQCGLRADCGLKELSSPLPSAPEAQTIERDNPQSAIRNPQSEAEGCYHQALEIARRQRAKSWELRAATSLARLWQQQGKRAEARQILAEIYGWFTEGFDTADLREARALLEELQTQP